MGSILTTVVNDAVALADFVVVAAAVDDLAVVIVCDAYVTAAVFSSLLLKNHI